MAKDRFVRGLNLVRRDLGTLLFHWTHTRKESREPFSSAAAKKVPAKAVLKEILNSGDLRGGNGYIKGAYNCVCFTEAPISEVAALFRLAESMPVEDRPRYEPYGIAVKKEWLFERGGRLVIYQPDAEYSLLPEELKWRHARYEPANGIDFTWEREWRVRVERLTLDPKATIVVVPTVDEAFDLMYGHADLEPDDWGDDGLPAHIYHKAKWLAVSLDFFGVSKP